MTRNTILLFALVAAGCNVPAPKGSRGTDLPALDAGDGDAGRTCSRAVVVDESDYMSTNVALLDVSGRVLTESLASSATRSVGLAAPLSGDVYSPTMPVTSGEVVLIDGSQGASRVVWVDPRTAAKRELSVATGFWSDPHDYVEISPHKAYVTRFNTNTSPGKAPFDAGGDVLVVDPSEPAITGRIDVSDALGDDRARVLPDADKIVVARGVAYVLLGALPKDFSAAAAPSRLVGIDTDTDAVVSTTVLDGFFDCAGLALSPDGTHIAVLCSGKRIDPSAPSDLSGSGVAVVGVGGTPEVVQRMKGTAIGDGPVGFFGAFAAPTTLLVETFGYDDPSSGASLDDTVTSVDLMSGTAEVALRSAGTPFTLGGITCDVPCGACFFADAGRNGGVVHRFSVDPRGALGEGRAIKVETNPGLPPRYLGRF
jgi:hypothetical protein